MPTNAKPSCQEKIGELRAWMTQAKSEGGHRFASATKREFSPVVLEGGDSINGPRIVMSINSEIVQIDGLPIAEGPIEGEGLASELKKFAANASGAKSVALVVDKETSWSRVVSAVQGVSQAGFTQINFVFHMPIAPGSMSAPPASSMSSEIAAWRKEQEAAWASRNDSQSHPVLGADSSKPTLLAKVAAECPALQHNIEEMPKQEPSQRIAHMTDNAVSAVAECGCAVDMAAFKEVYWYSVLARPASASPSQVGFTYAEDSAVKLTQSGELSWQEAHKMVVAQVKSGQSSFALLAE